MAYREEGLDKPFAALFGTLLVLGLLVLASASWPMGLERFGDGSYFVVHQLIFGVLLGVAGFAGAYLVPYEYLRKSATLALGVSMLLLVSVFIPGLQADFGTAHSWIRLGSFSIQPSEVVKLTYLIYLAAWLEGRKSTDLRDIQTGLGPFLMVLGAIAGLLILQPDTGSLMIIVAMSMAVYVSAGAPWRHVGVVVAGGATALGLLIAKSPYRAARLLTFLHPDNDPQGIGYHINQALLAVGSGGFFGRGYGHSVQKYQYLPEVAGDSIFAVLAEEFGFLLTVCFLALYLALIWRGLVIAERTPTAFGRYLAVGIMAWIGCQALVNIGAMVGMFPITGVPLPFVSYGGTALAMAMIGCGIMLNISKHAR
jgi:cell division protein FtsW